ncbi:hypothetical protein DFQ28_004679 [Apophysomyces sp. BC1034]|nr:hypothetical protein DFQ30_007317 [Apophysomyces sp. BC1015]KAG0183094.1 hypothetical protein DFQ29_000097 [Apophysomyces sp. BC1021]KAG0193559.1 hypothetical protein DFQ28_004679 [Apophysomyces sp. BC1034]
MQDTTPFPIQNRQAGFAIDGQHTEVFISGFLDKIFVIVTQYGKIGSLIQTTLDVAPHQAANPNAVPTTSHFLSGESNGAQSDLYVLYATSISQAIAAMNPNEKRPVLLGIALKTVEDNKRKDVFHAIMDKIMDNRVW